MLSADRPASWRNHNHEFLAAGGDGGSLRCRRPAGATRRPIATSTAAAPTFRDDSSAATDNPIFGPSSHRGHDQGVVQQISTTKHQAAKANIHRARRFDLLTARCRTSPIINPAFGAGRGSAASVGSNGLAVADVGPDMNNTAARPSVAAIHRLKAVSDPGPPSVTLGMACPPISFIRDGGTEAGSVDGHLF